MMEDQVLTKKGQDKTTAIKNYGAHPPRSGTTCLGTPRPLNNTGATEKKKRKKEKPKPDRLSLVIGSFCQLFDDHITISNSIHSIFVGHPRDFRESIGIPNHYSSFSFDNSECIASKRYSHRKFGFMRQFYDR